MTADETLRLAERRGEFPGGVVYKARVRVYTYLATEITTDLTRPTPGGRPVTPALTSPEPNPLETRP